MEELYLSTSFSQNHDLDAPHLSQRRHKWGRRRKSWEMSIVEVDMSLLMGGIIQGTPPSQTGTRKFCKILFHLSLCFLLFHLATLASFLTKLIISRSDIHWLYLLPTMLFSLNAFCLTFWFQFKYHVLMSLSLTALLEIPSSHSLSCSYTGFPHST